MNRIVLSDQEARKGQVQRGQSSSKMSALIQRCSFGLIKTQKQVALVQVGIIVLGLVWFLVTLVRLGGESESTVELTPELINAEQPSGSL
jgi:hypothetical protein